MHKTDTSNSVTIHPPDFAAVQTAPVAGDVARSRDHWLALARRRDKTIVYFSIYVRDANENKLAGQIFLHDYEPEREESLIGYHLFQPQYRGQGIGTRALQLLVEYVLAETPIRNLVIITDQDNHASQRIAQKNGFVYTGPAREGLPLIRYEWQRAPQTSA